MAVVPATDENPAARSKASMARSFARCRGGMPSKVRMAGSPRASGSGGASTVRRRSAYSRGLCLSTSAIGMPTSGLPPYPVPAVRCCSRRIPMS